MREWLYLFTGPDSFFLAQELQKRQQWFTEKYGKEQCITYTSDTISLNSIQEALQGWWLFANKKLIICKWIPDDKVWWGKAWAAIVKFFEWLIWESERTFSPDIILVFVSIDPDKRLKLYKLLAEKATVKSFPALNEWQITTFLQQKLGTYFSPSLAEYLISFVGSDLFRLSEEADKITTYLAHMGKQELTESERNAIIYTPLQVNAFWVLDAISAGNIKEALDLIDNSAQSQTARPEFIGMLYRWIKHMIQTVDLYHSGTKSAKDIAAHIGMHFFPIVKNLKYIDNLTNKKTALTAVFHQLILLDKDIKSGRFPQEWFRAAVKDILWRELE